MKWETKKLGEIAQIVSGSTPKRNNSKFWDGEIFFATPKDLSNLSSKYLEKTANKITKEGLESCSTQILPINSILLSSRAPIGLVAITKVALCTNQGFKSLVLKDNISPDYVYYFLKASTKQLNALGRGATFKEISKKIVEKVQIPLPPLAEQERIAAILDKADALHARTRAQLAAYDELLQAVFLEMFGDPVLNEKGWPKNKLKDFGEIITGNTPSKRNAEYYSSKFIEWVKTKNIEEGKTFLTKAEKYLSKKGASAGRIIKPNALLVCCIAGSIKSIGKVALADRKVAFNQQINAIQPTEEINSLFLYSMVR